MENFRDKGYIGYTNIIEFLLKSGKGVRPKMSPKMWWKKWNLVRYCDS